MKVPFFDLSGQHRSLRPEIDAAIGRVLDSGQFILGPAVQELEQEIAAYVRKRFAVGVSSGTDALLLSLMALGIGPGDVVLTTPFSFFATAGTIARLGAIPLLADIDPSTFNPDPAQAEKALLAFLDQDPGLYPLPSDKGVQFAERRTPNERLKVILPVHLYGQAADMPSFNQLAQKHGLGMVEDAAQAIGAAFPDPEAGALYRDNLVCYSFYPTKNLGGVGDAGMVVTDNPEFADKLKRIRVHGAQTRYVHDLIGGNFRLDSLQAAVLAVKLKHLDHWTRKRQENAGVYETLFGQIGFGRSWSGEPSAGCVPWSARLGKGVSHLQPICSAGQGPRRTAVLFGSAGGRHGNLLPGALSSAALLSVSGLPPRGFSGSGKSGRGGLGPAYFPGVVP